MTVIKPVRDFTPYEIGHSLGHLVSLLMANATTYWQAIALVESAAHGITLLRMLFTVTNGVIPIEDEVKRRLVLHNPVLNQPIRWLCTTTTQMNAASYMDLDATNRYHVHHHTTGSVYTLPPAPPSQQSDAMFPLQPDDECAS